MNNNILHVCNQSPIIVEFVRFAQKHFDLSHHVFLHLGESKKYTIDKYDGINHVFIKKLSQSLTLAKYFYKSDKVILHGLFDARLILFLTLNPWLLHKCYWIIWGADLTFHGNRKQTIKNNLIEKMRGIVIKRLGHIITYIRGDYELAQRWYGTLGSYHVCFMYPSNIFTKHMIVPKTDDSICVQVGNSADPANNHLEVFEKLLCYKEQNLKIYVPLSYGNFEYAQQIITIGTGMFGDKFIPLTDFLAIDKYQEFLANIDIAIFNHKEQQAMGNTIALLGLGKKVFIRKEVTPWKAFEELGIKVFDVNNFALDLIDSQTKDRNIEKVKEVFTEKNLVKQLSDIYGQACSCPDSMVSNKGE